MSSKHRISAHTSDSDSTTSSGKNAASIHGTSSRSPDYRDHDNVGVFEAMSLMHITSRPRPGSKSHSNDNAESQTGPPLRHDHHSGGIYPMQYQQPIPDRSDAQGVETQPPTCPGYGGNFAAQQSIPPSNQNSQHFMAYPSYPTYEANSVKDFWEPPPSTPAAGQTSFGN
ncbi:hypothetical protein K435DRAFT_783277 [Dendrothele bispora CBS 962.96]|uniref:Uncharacterized protein n=1 Tax=Dendrothele bispora (strain CBS 962.96) TaxID=1314807 RepID=A0A4S8L9X0_DENBC|nr:hypothetical protein K435DRAFT_783277 [Dendrothele bispora CBS 962.96]